MKYTLLYLGLLVASLTLGALIVIMPKDGPRRFYLLADVLFASVILGLLVAHVISLIR